MSLQNLYQKAILFAVTKHNNQTRPASQIPYVVHLSKVAMEILVAAQHTPEFNTALTLQVALLHDVIEDTATTPFELEQQFGVEVAAGVLALTKNSVLPKDKRMSDSLIRLNLQPDEIRAVKIADRITNLQSPPSSRDKTKCREYLDEASKIQQSLGSANAFLNERLLTKMNEYRLIINHCFPEKVSSIIPNDSYC